MQQEGPCQGHDRCSDLFINAEPDVRARQRRFYDDVIVKWVLHPMHARRRHTVICRCHLVRTVPLVTVESIHDDKKKSNRRRLVQTSP